MQLRRAVRTGKLSARSGVGVRRLRQCAAFLVPALLAGCISISSKPPGIGAPVPWSALPDWEQDRPAQAWPGLLSSCTRLAARDARWRALCADAELFPEPDDATARAFFETRFVPHEVINESGRHEGLVTGYYEPLLHGSLVKTKRYRYPIYRTPPDLLAIDLAELYPELRGKTLRGRLHEHRVVPYFSRAEIGDGANPLAGNELVWVDDPVALFFLQIQGSGRVQLPDRSTLFVGYADQNGHPYTAIGRKLIEMGALTPEEVSLQSIRDWLQAHPNQAEAVLNSNPSYVFFTLRDPELPGPIGSLSVPLVPERSIAVDPAYIPLGTPVWVDTVLPPRDDGARPYRRLVFAQDTGGAVKGAVRADVFFGYGAEAEDLAGRMKQSARLYVLLPVARELVTAPN